MTALTKDRLQTKRRASDSFELPAAADKIFAGAIVLMNAAGYVGKGITVATARGVGVCTEYCDNSGGAAGDKKVKFRRGLHGPFANSASGDLITLAEVGTDCYIVDDQTVAKTSNSSARSVAGKVRDVDNQGVWVEF